MSHEVAVEGRNGLAQNKSYFPREVAPPVDVFENAEEVLVVADLPGVPNSAIDVRLENGTLTLQAKREAERVPDGPSRDEVTFTRAFRVPASIDAAAISAEAKNGTLVVRLPKAASAKPRKIAVR